jgi:hypothetical protein
VNEDEVLAFVQKSIKSVWALELLLLLRRNRQRAWSTKDLVLEMRSSEAAVAEALSGLRGIGFVSAESDGFRYESSNPDLDRISGSIEELYSTKPLAVAKAIISAPNDKLRLFADAFKLKGR